jgi:hypothetical protein
MELITLALASLATARLTRLIVKDAIFMVPRERLVVALPARLEPLAYLLGCTWCASVYAGAGMAGAWYAWGDTRWFTAVAAALAFSHISGWLATHEGKGEH